MNAGILGNSGPKPSFTDPDTGKRYEVSYLTQGLLVAFEQWLKDRAREEVVKLRNDLTPEQYAAEMRVFLDHAVAGDYGILGSVGRRASETLAGTTFLATQLLGCNEEEAFGLFLRHGAALKAVIDQVVAESMPRVPRSPPNAEVGVQNASNAEIRMQNAEVQKEGERDGERERTKVRKGPPTDPFG